jgi:hypothetical protein
MTSCYIALYFKPQSLGTNGTLSTTLTVKATPGNTVTLSLSGTAVSALTTNESPGPVVVNTTNSSVLGPNGEVGPYPITVYIAAFAPQTAFLKTSISGSDYKIVYDSCVATKLSGMGGPYACEIGVVYLGTANTPLKTGTLTVNGGSAGQSVSLVLNSTTTP